VDFLKKVDIKIRIKKALFLNLQNSLFMSMLRRKFSKEQKLEIVKESLEESVVIEELASRYKIHANSIYKWRREYLQHQESAFPGHGIAIQSEEQKEIASLKKQLRELELEKEILKKALGIFSSTDRKNLLS
jgi:transposase-like protein